MRQHYIHRVQAYLVVTVPEAVVEKNLGYLPWLLGENLAGRIDPYALEQGLGYYPALALFRDLPEVIDPALLQLNDEVAAFAIFYSQRMIQRHLADLFTTISVEQANCTAFTLPRIRPAQQRAPLLLAEHYAPNRVKLELLLTAIHSKPVADIEQMVLRKISSKGREPFSSMAITGSHLLDRTLVSG